MKWDYRAEIKVQVFLKLLLCCERLPGQYARAEVSGLLLGNGLEHFYQILSAADTASRCFFLLDGNYEHFYYLTNDQYGDTLLKLLCSSEKITELNRMLMQGLSPKDTGLPIEHDALDGDGSPVLFGYFLDIPRINRFHTALRLQERTGTLVCFDFQREVLHRFCGDQVEFSTISFEKFETSKAGPAKAGTKTDSESSIKARPKSRDKACGKRGGEGTGTWRTAESAIPSGIWAGKGCPCRNRICGQGFHHVLKQNCYGTARSGAVK